MGTVSRGGKQNIDFLGRFLALEDPRQETKVVYPLDEILHLSLCATLSGADSWVPAPSSFLPWALASLV